MALETIDPVADGKDIQSESTPAENVKLGAKAYRAGDTALAVKLWTSAAEQGHAVAQWRLARMYADGKGVARDDAAAFKWFKKLIDDHADDEPGTLQGQLAGKAFLELGTYYHNGVPGGAFHIRDNEQAWKMYYQAASVFGDQDAQYQLGLMCLEGEGIEKNVRLGVNWLRNAAEKGHVEAQAKLGDVLFSNADTSRGRIEGLMWLSIARNKMQPATDSWIATSFEDAYTLASDDERMKAATYVRRWEQQNAK